MKHQGSLEDLKGVVASVSKGDWTDVTHGHQFKAPNGASLIWYPKSGTLQLQGPAAEKEAFGKLIEEALGKPSSPSIVVSEKAVDAKERVFVVHGHDSVAREQLELVLHKLGLDPFVLANSGGGGLTIIEALEAEIGPGEGRSRFGIVLMTPDDIGYAKAAGADKAEPRARQNVVLEMGMLIAALGRSNVAILKKQHLEVPSDANGILYLSFNDHVKETVPKLVDRLQKAGFKVDSSKIAYASC
ncbi:MAG TPA: nucleotide-binding protein [Vicinamibacterales bacterium]|nr:nucleotide-binding protein [Vicinamibacterales bacterium]